MVIPENFRKIGWLFTVLRPAYGDVTIAGEGLKI
jgi:hypothetical protein